MVARRSDIAALCCGPFDNQGTTALQLLLATEVLLAAGALHHITSVLPSPLKSPSEGTHSAAGDDKVDAVVNVPSPFDNQGTTALQLLPANDVLLGAGALHHITSVLPSPLKSPSEGAHPAAGDARLDPAVNVPSPLDNQIMAALQLLPAKDVLLGAGALHHTTSVLPSPLKSPAKAPTRQPARPN